MENSEKPNAYLDETRETSPWKTRREKLNQRFLKQMAYVFSHSRAYQDIFSKAGATQNDIRSLDDLEKLPITKMKDLTARQKEDFPFGGFDTMGSDFPRRIYINPGLIWQPGELEYNDTSWAEGLCGAGVEKGDMVLNTFNYHMWPFAFMLDESAKMIGATIVPTGAGNTLMQIKILQMLGIQAVMGTPSFLMTLIQRAEGMGVNVRSDLRLRKGFVCAEMLPESLRARLEKMLDATIRQAYGTVFLGCIGYECLHNTGLHITDNIIVEVVDPHTGRQVPFGKAGEVVVTTFSSTFPLVRMATGDLSLFTGSDCPCGRTAPKLKKILGRIDQATKVRGTFIHPWQVDEVMARYPEVFKYQVVITRKNHSDVMTFVVELTEEISAPGSLQARIERDIKDMLTVRGDVHVAPRGSIPDFHKKIDDRRSWE